MYRKQVRRRRAVLGLLVAASIALLTAYFGESTGGALHGMQRGVVAVLAPIEEGANRALKPARDFIGWIGDTVDAKSENKKLKRQLDGLRSRLAAAETAQAENRQLRGLVGFSQSSLFPQGFDEVTSRVIGRSPTVWYSRITIDRGRSSGLRIDQPVVNAEGLVGKVTAVTAGTAQVTLITDHSSAVTGMVVPGGASGVIKPRVGDPEDLLLDFIEKGRRLRRGQTVVTAGFRSEKLESLFPRGIPIGTIRSANVEEQETYQRAHVRPFADVRRLDFVAVLIRGRAGRGAAGLRASVGDGR